MNDCNNLTASYKIISIHRYVIIFILHFLFVFLLFLFVFLLFLFVVFAFLSLECIELVHCQACFFFFGVIGLDDIFSWIPTLWCFIIWSALFIQLAFLLQLLLEDGPWAQPPLSRVLVAVEDDTFESARHSLLAGGHDA